MDFITKKDGKKLKNIQKINKPSFSNYKTCIPNFIINFFNKQMKTKNTL